MIESFAFRTRARTIDHLGREQIADCPTAVSELWKNAYDAYARNVFLNIFDGKVPIATVVDDGHGMNREDFEQRWFTVGTESKADQRETPEADMNGLPLRMKQGQKGIGRLSSASLGSLLLVVSKRKDSPFVASLVDWRLFENPFLYVSDLEIPFVEFQDKLQLIPSLPELFERLMGNVWGDTYSGEPGRNERIERAWDRYTKQELDGGKSDTTRSRIESTAIETAFDERHFEDWPIWAGETDHGTMLAVSDIQFDLKAQLPGQDRQADSAVNQAQAQLRQTLSNFTDPFLNADERQQGYAIANFATRVVVWEGALRRTIISEEPEIDFDNLQTLEHVVDGEISAEGIFTGRIKAFGTWLDGQIRIVPATDIPMGDGSNVGPFQLRIATFEQQLSTTTLEREVYKRFESLTESHAGLLVYRNGLRVMPYGREGNDFFQVEKRRTKHAGREFWSLRRLFGRVAIGSNQNPNLRDKAGREGLIDNRAAKCFRDLVENILMTTARNYFGSDAKLRKEMVPELKDQYRRQKAEEEHKKQRALHRRTFTARLDNNLAGVAAVMHDVQPIAQRLAENQTENEADLIETRTAVQDLKRRLVEHSSCGETPRVLGSLEDKFEEYSSSIREATSEIDVITESLNAALERAKPKAAHRIAHKEVNANHFFLRNRLREWAKKATDILESEKQRVAELLAGRSKAYQDETIPFVEDVENGRMTLTQALANIDEARNEHEFRNSELFEPYIAALSSLRESIDLVGLAKFGVDQADELREEVDRLYNLAQLGITVEIIGHEIEGFEHTITSGLKSFPESVKQTGNYSAVKDSYEGLVDRLRFLSPLRLSGPKTRVVLSGEAIFEFLKGFFKHDQRDVISCLDATPAFLRFSVYEQPARIYPVFVNLINNAAYWVSHSSRGQKRIVLDAVDGKVVIADSGPGVDESDRKRLFSLFFTRKVRGGRGVGLYLTRANLAAGGHTIHYADTPVTDLPGANFVIDFKGASYA